MKINVYVLDDEAAAAERVLHFLECYQDLDISIFTSYEQLAECGEQLTNAEVAFVDVQFGEHTGFDVVKLINQYTSKCIFSFFTNYSEYLKQGYEYRIHRYILKEEPKELIEKQIKETIDEYYKLNKYIKISEFGNERAISLNEVVYIDALNHTSTFHMADGTSYNWNKQLNHISDNCLNNKFVRCHKSYIVNMDYIDSVYKLFRQKY